jgi:hypothetical protein
MIHNIEKLEKLALDLVKGSHNISKKKMILTTGKLGIIQYLEKFLNILGHPNPEKAINKYKSLLPVGFYKLVDLEITVPNGKRYNDIFTYLDTLEMKIMKIDINIEDIIYNYPTRYKEGFIQEEIDLLLSWFPTIKMDKFNEVMMGNTCKLSKDNEVINYHCDVLTALLCGLENRDIKPSEFD